MPILALSATCPPDVLRDLIAILSLRPLTNGAGTVPRLLSAYCHLVLTGLALLAADPRGTVLFTSPLYRKNLHYKVLPKSSYRAGPVRDMVKFILERHPNETGIVYCLSRAVSTLLLECRVEVPLVTYLL